MLRDGLSSKRILIADDNAELRELVALVLRDVAGDVVAARDGRAAWDTIRAHRPALAVLDADMPGYSGVQVARRVRADPALAATRLLIITAHANAEAAGLTAGADRWLAKPFSPRELRDVARALLADTAETADTADTPQAAGR